MNYNDFYKWVYDNLGLSLEGYKQGQLTRRIENLMKRLEIKNLRQFTELMKKNSDYENKFLDFITINVTEFFRNPDLYKNLEKSLNESFGDKSKRIKIWSAACSLGCEPYTMAMILKENGYKNFQIIATDIDRNVLSLAKKAVYSSNELKNIPNEYMKYFDKKGDLFYLNFDIKKAVSFKKSDLILDEYEKGFDIVLCRNVVIYFNGDIKNIIYKKISNSLNKGGLFFVGATENISNFKEYGFEKESTFIYKKV